MARKSNGGGSADGSDFESKAVFMGAALLILVIGGWFLFGPRLTALLTFLRSYEMLPFTVFSEQAVAIEARLMEIRGEPGYPVTEFGRLVAMLSVTGVYVRWLYIPIFPVLAYFLFAGCTRLKHQRQHSMTSLVKQEAALWPEISPVVGKQDSLIKGDANAGEWASALTEWEFAEKHGLAVRPDANKNLVLDREKARAVFAGQIGRRWTRTNRQAPYQKGLYAAFLLRIVGESKEALAKLRLMSSTYAKGGINGMDVTWVDAVIAKHGRHPDVQRAISQHAYVSTVLATMLQLSRWDGVIASPMFLWLKPVDRQLWYLLNNVGRYAFHVECAGVVAHWLYEKTVGVACVTPMVEGAISKTGKRLVDGEMKDVLLGGLEMALTEYSEDDTLDRLYK